LLALNYLHLKNICHRDIKLENIMLLEDGDSSCLKLIDFGLARDISDNKNKNILCSGTPYYIAPEVIK
jgi:calcium-dependent protein kinase